jgi:hypothetical protein
MNSIQDNNVHTEADLYIINIIAIMFVYIIVMLFGSIFIQGYLLELHTITMIKKMKEKEEQSLDYKLCKALNIKVPKREDMSEKEQKYVNQIIDNLIKKYAPRKKSFFE